MSHMYVLVSPTGHVYHRTLADSPSGCWDNGSFDIISSEQTTDEWRKKYWKRLGPSKTSARRLGYMIHKCRIVLE